MSFLQPLFLIAFLLMTIGPIQSYPVTPNYCYVPS
jgi:hypothetical protein